MSTFQINDRMMSRLHRGNDDDSDEQKDDSRKPENHVEEQPKEENLLDLSGDLNGHEETIIHHRSLSGADERYCIVSYDLREETANETAATHLDEQTREDLLASAQKQLREYRHHQQSEGSPSLPAATENPLIPNDNPNDEYRNFREEMHDLALKNIQRYELEDELRERSQSTDRYPDHLSRNELLNDACQQVRQFLSERDLEVHVEAREEKEEREGEASGYSAGEEDLMTS